jgi:hypothetical protein
MTTTTEVSDSLERVDSIFNMLDEICDHMDGFSSAEDAWLSSITETLRTGRYVMHETESKGDKRATRSKRRSIVGESKEKAPREAGLRG